MVTKEDEKIMESLSDRSRRERKRSAGTGGTESTF